MFATKLFQPVFALPLVVLLLFSLFALAGCKDCKGPGKKYGNIPVDVSENVPAEVSGDEVPANVPMDASGTNHGVRVLELESDFPALTQSGVVMVDFTATWCPPCRMLAPILDEVAKKVQGKAVIVKVDTDKFPGLAKQFKIGPIPNMLIFKDGQVVDQLIGLKDAATLEAAIEKAAR